jgi:5-methylcytosine-specific restriction endonuclease McrA
MPWQQTSNRVVPPDWDKRKRAVLERDARICHVCGHGDADEVDHLVNVARWQAEQMPGDPHDLDNLAAIHGGSCSTCGRRCHTEKTQAEAAHARAINRTKSRHPVERHPGRR